MTTTQTKNSALYTEYLIIQKNYTFAVSVQQKKTKKQNDTNCAMVLKKTWITKIT